MIRVGDRPVVVRAIAPRGFAGIDIDAVDMWLPLGGYTGFRERPGHRWFDEWGTIAFRIIARVPPGASPEKLAARVESGVRAAAAFIAANPRPGGRANPLVRAVPGSIMGALGPDGTTHGETIAAVLGALALLLLVMATANVGNLLLGRALDRRREIAMRVALGMSRWRLVSQLAIELLLLAVAATVAAIVAAAWMGGILRSMLLPGLHLPAGPIDRTTRQVALQCSCDRPGTRH